LYRNINQTLNNGTVKNILYASLFLLLMNSTFFAQHKDHRFLTSSLDIDQQLKKYKLPGFRVVVFENYRILYSEKFGIKSLDS